MLSWGDLLGLHPPAGADGGYGGHLQLLLHRQEETGHAGPARRHPAHPQANIIFV